MRSTMWKIVALLLGVSAVAIAVLAVGSGRAGALWLGAFALFAWSQGRGEHDLELATMQHRALLFASGVSLACLAAVVYAVVGDTDDRGRSIGFAILLGFLAIMVWTLWWRDREIVKRTSAD